MARKLVLCASTSRLTAGIWNGRRLDRVYRFEDSERDQQAFANFLHAAHGVPAYLMADTVDEDYRFETLPHATGKDRRDMVERKLKQLYRSTPLYGFSLQDREDSKRRDDRYLFAALTNPEALNPWLRILTASGLPIAGVFPVPMISLSLIKTLELTEPNLLLVSKHEAGVRQTFVKDQRFRISRLTPLRAGGGTIDSCAEEIRNTRMYLDALNVTHVDDILTVVILDQDGALATLRESVVRGRRNLRALHVSPQDIGTKVGIHRTALEESADALHLFLLGQRKSPAFNLAPPTLTSGFTRHLISRGIYAGSIGLGILTMAWCAWEVFQTVGLKQLARDTAEKTRAQQVEYQRVTRSFPPAPVRSDKLQLTVDVAGRIGSIARLPDTVFSTISQALDKYPSMRLNSVQWQLGRVGPESGNASAATSAPLSQSATLQMELTAQPGDIKGALASINSFVRELGKGDKVAEAKVTRMPLNFASTGNLSGSTTNPRLEKPQTSQFDVEVVFKPGV
jgi:hypothetical protein